MASRASAGSEYRSPNIALAVGAGILTGIVGIGMPVIGLAAGFDGMDVLANPAWGFAYNAVAGAINLALGSTPGTTGGMTELLIGSLAWPLFVCAVVSYAIAAFQRWQGGRLKTLGLSPFCLTLVINMPASWFTSSGPACGFFLYPALIY